MAFYIEPVIKPAKKARKPRKVKEKIIDEVVAVSDAPALEQIEAVAAEYQQGSEYAKIEPEPDTYFWADRFGQREIVLIDHRNKFCYLHGMEHVESLEHVTLLHKIEKL